MRELLTWVAHAPRTYTDAMEAWGSHCPRFTVWEDALDGELVRVAGSAVKLTARGRSALNGVSSHPSE
jgi:hypothetical protein